ncbi:Gfo/Idh/MocA family protein [Vitreimonas flagellata]|uniref:Gfo/Idh/MocA family protein n=1 Tax=Vitreimonas flagellata TaxID=2560861 RepID=UPI001074ACEB|nr:Gfo/Idh/MocA family oxidoreductase [Vitreimonas flagellata]
MTRLRAGVLGAGAFGRIHARKYAEDTRVHFVGVYDPDDERADQLADTHGAESFGALDALLKEIDVLTIASPPSFHAANARAALLAGKHVLVEKPLATDAALGAELVAIAAANKCVLACGHQERLVFDAMGLFSAPERPTRIESVREGPWTGRSADVSVTLDLMVHDLDLALKLMGRSADRVSATAHAEHGKAADQIVATLGFGDAEAVFTSSRIAADRKRTMRAVYPSGEIRIDFLARSFENTTSFPLNAAFAETRIGADPLGANVSIFIDAVLGVAPRPVVNGEEALAVLKLALDVDRASGLPSHS